MSAAINLGLLREQVGEQVWVRGGGEQRHSAADAAEQPAGAAECRLNAGRGSEADAKNNCVHDNSSASAQQRGCFWSCKWSRVSVLRSSEFSLPCVDI